MKSARQRVKQQRARSAAQRRQQAIARRPRLPWWQSPVQVEWMMAGVGLFLAAFCNRALFAEVGRSGAFDEVGGWTLAAGLFIAIAAAHVLLLSLIPGRTVAKVAMSAMIVAGVAASAAASVDVAYLEPAALRPSLDVTPTWPRWLTVRAMGSILLVAGPVVAVVWWIRLAPRPWPIAALARICLLVAASLAFVAGIRLPGHTTAHLQDEHRDWMQLVTPLNLLFSPSPPQSDASRSSHG